MFGLFPVFANRIAAGLPTTLLTQTILLMKDFFPLRVALLLLLLCGSLRAAAQNRAKATFRGTICSTESGAGGKSQKTPLAYAVVSLPEIGLATATDVNGMFEIQSIDPGSYLVEISSLGYETLSRSIVLPAERDFEFLLQASSFYLENVVVSAESKKTGASTASKISKSAMDHIQATSLADVMSLLPGAQTRTASEIKLENASSFGVRNGSSFGTAVIMDGAPVSNNANMQTMSVAIGSEAATSIATPNTGIDMRTITTSNIESVEVIRGIASARYGDISSGAVIVNSKAGRSPLSVQMDLNPNVYMASVSHGVGLGSRGGVLNYGVDYTFSQKDLTEGYDTYNRATGRLAYSNLIGKWSTNTSMSFFYTRDKGEPNPDDENDRRTTNQRDLGLRFNTNGSLNFNNGWFKSIRYAASVDYTNKHTYFEDVRSNADWTYSTSKIDGAVLSSFPSRDIYLEDGTKITNIPEADADGKAWRLPSSYTEMYNLYGKELTTYAQVSALFSGDIGPTRHSLTVGADFRSSGNLGRGKVFDPESPPYRTLGENFATQRERAFRDVPFMNHIGLFLEENFAMDILSRRLDISAGVRYDKVFDMKKGGLAPRLNASYELIPGLWSIRGGYGITFKTPSLAYLYPDNAYFDILNFDNSAQSSFSDAQKFQIATTHVYSAANPDLELSKTYKWEVGTDFQIGQVRGSVTYFRDRSENGYMLSQTFDTFKSVDYIQYEAAKPENETDLPVLSVKSSDKILLNYRIPTNFSAYETEGVELDIDFGRIDAIRTSFGLNGSWMKYRSWKNYYTFNNRPGGSTVEEMYPHMGVFEPGNTVNHSTRTTTNLRATHNIPRIGFVVTLTASITWHERNYTTYGNDSIPVKYISRLDGQVYDFDPSRIDEPEFQRIDMRPSLDTHRLVLEGAMPPILCMNINVTKEIRDFMRISFFANNMFRSTPIWESKKTPGSFIRRNANTFFFGAALSIKIK